MVSGPNGSERAWTFKRLPENKGWDAGVVMQVKGSPSGTVNQWHQFSHC